MIPYGTRPEQTVIANVYTLSLFLIFLFFNHSPLRLLGFALLVLKHDVLAFGVSYGLNLLGVGCEQFGVLGGCNVPASVVEAARIYRGPIVQILCVLMLFW